MLHYFLKRLLGLLPTLFLVAVIVFLFVHMLPGDPARLAAGPEADQVTVELVRKDLGLPVWRRGVWRWTGCCGRRC